MHSYQSLQKNLEEKDNFILTLSHDIRNPLTSLLGNLDIAYEEAT